MNGDRTPQQYAEAAESYALETKQKALEIADSALRMEQVGARMERGLDDVRREMRGLQSKVAVGLASIREQLGNAKSAAPRHELQSFSDTEWEDSPTGTHKIKKVRRAEFETWQKERELTADARKWRKVLNTSGKIALAIVLVILGGVIRHYLFGGH